MGKLRQAVFMNLAMLLLLCSAFFLLFFSALHWLTNQGKEVKVPALAGKDMNTAITELHAFHFEVAIDSAYEPAAGPLTVLKQIPGTGSIVKTGRTIFLTVNKIVPKNIPMPALIELNLKSAQALLQENKLVPGDIVYKPSVSEGAILEQLYNGKAINPGTMIPQGCKISLVLGDGTGKKQHEMPDVTEMTLDMALTSLSPYNLQIEVIPGTTAKAIDTSTDIVTGQLPEPKKVISNGDKVVLYVK